MILPPPEATFRNIHGYIVVIYAIKNTFRAVWISRDGKVSRAFGSNMTYLLNAIDRLMAYRKDI